MNRHRIACTLLFLTIFSLNGLSAHKYHSSLTLADYNAKEKVFEITIQLFTHDLVPVLRKLTDRAGDLKSESAADIVLLDYLNENFVLRKDNERIGKLVWVGKETNVDRVNVFVEVAFDGDPEGLELKNTIFFESFTEQKNLTTVKIGEKKSDHLFKVR